MIEPPCPRCGADLGDGVRNGWCAACQDYTGGVRELDARAKLYDGGAWYYDRSGNKITLGRWSWLSEHKAENDYYRVAEDTVDLYWVSTVWVGLDMGIPMPGIAPLIFETMTFLAGEGQECYRWSSEARAIAGHDRIVAEVREQLSAPSANGDDE